MTARSASLIADLRAHVGSFELRCSVQADPGEILAVLGPNGAGKSTLLGALAGHIPGVTGSIRLGDAVLHADDGLRVPPEHRRVGLLGQRSQLFPHLSVLENVAFGPRAQGARRADARADAVRLLDEVGLAGFEDRRPSQLSGGQQQRAVIARALAARPGALLLDEPFSGLDAQTATQARRLIMQLRDTHGIPMILVTHDALDAMMLANRTIVLQDGGVVQRGSTQDVLGHPGSAFVAVLAGVNLVTGRADADGGLVHLGAGGPPLVLPRPTDASARAGDDLTAVFAPSAVRVRPHDASTDAGHAGDSALWVGTVHSLEPIPGGVRITTIEHPEIAVDCSSAVAVGVGVQPGARLSFALSPADVSVRPVI